MMWREVLKAVDRDLAEELPQILIRKGWNAGHQRSYPVVEVMVRTETDEEAAPLRTILARHVHRRPEDNQMAMEIWNRQELIRELPQHGQNPDEVEETFEELQNNPLRAEGVFNEHSNGRERFYLSSTMGGYSIGFSSPKDKKRIKFWLVGRRSR
ncbi:MAG: hypothetical protein V1932_04700 [Chloroflexota bacterium]